MTIDFKENVEIELENKFSFSVNYNDDNSACLAILQHDLNHKNDPEKFHISVEGIAQFSCEGVNSDDAKKEAHMMAYSILFPYVQRMIRNLSTDAGLPPLIIPMAKMKAENVQLTPKK